MEYGEWRVVWESEVWKAERGAESELNGRMESGESSVKCRESREWSGVWSGE